MATAGALQIESQLEGGRARMTLVGELDIATIPRLQAAVDALLEQRPREVVVDLRSLGFLDSSGLREFILLADRAAGEGWSLLLVRPEEPVLAIFQITRAEEQLPFVDQPPPLP
jgi:anti-sigma B factor antagonist